MLHALRPILALIAFLGLVITVAGARAPEADSRGPSEVAMLLDLDSDRSGRVAAIFREADEKMRFAREELGPPADEAARALLHAVTEAIRADTEAKLAAVLTAAEMEKLLASQPPRPGNVAVLRFKKI